MLSFFSDILGYLEVFGSFISNLFRSFVMAFNAMMNSISVILAIVGFVPAIIGASVAIGLVLYVIKFLLGR